jgi:hypothetical protein
MPALSQLWSILVRNRTRLIALLLIVSFFAPQPANAQFGFLLGLINIVTSGMNTLNNVMTSVNNALRNVIGPILQQINSIMTAAQQIMGAIFDFQRNVLLSRDAGQIGSVGGNFSAVYTPLPAATEAHPAQRDLIDSSDAAAQAAMKRAIAIDAIADQELAAAEQMMTALQSTAPGTAEMIGAQAGAWLVRSNAYTQQALAELMRIRTIELAAQSARMKESARFTRETRNKLTELNK